MYLFQFEIVCIISHSAIGNGTVWQNCKTVFKIYYEACELSKKSKKKAQINILFHIISEECREVAEQDGGHV